MKNKNKFELDENQASFSWGDIALCALLIGMMLSIIVGAAFRFVFLLIGGTYLLERGENFYKRAFVKT